MVLNQVVAEHLRPVQEGRKQYVRRQRGYSPVRGSREEGRGRAGDVR